MAIAFVSQTSLGGTAASVSAISPSGAAAGHILVVDIITAGATVTGVPSGWTQITNVQTGLTARLFAYYHIVGASDPGPWVFTLSASGAYSHICACYSGVDNTTPLDVAATTLGSNTAGTSVIVPAVSPVTANTMLHSGVGEGATNRTITNPAGMTSIVEVTVGRRQEAAWQAIAATGTTGTRTWSFSGSVVYNAYMVPLRPATNVPATLVGTAATATAQAEASTFTGGTGGGGGTAPTFVSVSTTGNASATSIDVAQPASLATGDVLVGFLSADGTPTLGAPGDWTAAHAEVGGATKRARTWYKVVTNAGTEPANYTFTASVASPIVGVVVAYRGADTTTPMDAAATASDNASSLDVTATSITTVTANATVIWAGQIDSSTFTCTEPASTTQRLQTTTNRRTTVADFVQATAGATGDKLGTIGTARESVGVHVALRPLAAGGTPATLVGTAATATAQAEAATFKGASTLLGTAATTTSAAGVSALLGQAKLTGTAATATSQAGASAFIAASKLIAGSATATAQAEQSSLNAAQSATFVAGTATATAQAGASAFAGQAKIAATAATATATATASAITAASKLIAAAATATAQAEASNFSAGGAVVFIGGTATANAAAPQSTLAAQAKLTATAATATAAAGASTFGVAATFVGGTATATAAAAASTFKAASKLIAASATATAQAESSSFLAGGAVTFAAGTATANAAASASTMRGVASLFGSAAAATALAGATTFSAAARLSAGSASASAQAGASDMFAVIFAPPLAVLTTRTRPTLVAEGPDALTAPGRVAVLTGDHE